MSPGVPRRPEENIGPMETEAQEVVSPVWGLGDNSGPLQEQYPLLIEHVSSLEFIFVLHLL